MGSLTGFAIGLSEAGGASESSRTSSSTGSSSGPSRPTPDFEHTYVHSMSGDRWGCFGRNDGGRKICSGGGRHRIPLARCLSDPSGTAGIIYGITGVCHQAANRILYPAGRTVSRAKGYAVSCLQYGGAYGEPASWLVQLGRCRIATRAVPFQFAEEIDGPPEEDFTEEERKYNEKIFQLYQTAPIGDPLLAGRDLEILIELLCGPGIQQEKIADLQNHQVILHRERDSLIQSWYKGEMSTSQYAQNSNAILKETLQDFERTLGQNKYTTLFSAIPQTASQLLYSGPSGLGVV